MRLARGITPLVLLAALAIPGAAGARERNDVIMLKGGDRIACEIIELESAVLSLRTPAFGTVSVDWPDVTGLLSIQRFEVRRSDGTRLIGRLDVADSPRVLVVRVDESSAVEVPFSDVVRITQVGARLGRAVRGHVDLGSSYAQTSGQYNFTLEAEVAVHRPRFRWVNTLSTTIADNAESERSERDVVQSLLEVPTGKHFLVLGWALHERNDDLDLVARETLGAALTWIPFEGAHGRVGLRPRRRPEPGGLLLAGGHQLGDQRRPDGRGRVLPLRPLRLEGLALPLLFPGPHGRGARAPGNQGVLPPEADRRFHPLDQPLLLLRQPPSPGRREQEDWGWTTSVGWQF